MKSIFTGEDVKNLIDNMFNGNLWASKLAGQTYSNPNSETVVLIDEDNGTETETDLASYLNVKFYNWKERLVEKDRNTLDETGVLSVFDDWVQSLNFSMNETYALVEKIDEELTISPDIDSSTITGRVTFLVQTNKVKNLDYYVTKLQKQYLGNPETIQNSFGDKLTAYILIGALMYEQEPFVNQLGECLVCSFNFKINYLTEALTWNDTKIEISLNGDDLYDAQGNIIDENGQTTTVTKYLEMPITKASFQNIFTSASVPTAERPDMTGFIATSISTAKTLSFYDINKNLTMQFNDLFWSCTALKVDGQVRVVGNVNIPVWFRITSNGHFYIYKDVIDNMQKSLTNSDFNICSITTKGWGKIQ